VNNASAGEANFKHRTAFKEFMKGLEVPENFFSIEDVQEADEVANAMHTIKVMIENIKTACKADKIEVYLSGKNNFRDNLPLPSKYKSNRKDTVRPLLLDDLRLYLINIYKAKIINNEEVDDVLCHRMYEGFKSGQKIIGVTQDKDARGSQGWLYNPEKMVKPEYIDGLGELYLNEKGEVKGQGRKWGYLQWLIGDSTDGYKPTEICGARYGEKSAYKLLHELTTDKECIKAVYDQYKKWYPDEVKYTSWDGREIVTDVIGIMQMYMDCYRMRRWENDEVDVRALLKKLEIIE
jgi:hypothetical protein